MIIPGPLESCEPNDSPNDEGHSYRNRSDAFLARRAEALRTIVLFALGCSLYIIYDYSSQQPVLPEHTCTGIQYIEPGSDFYPKKTMSVGEFAGNTPSTGELKGIIENIIATNPVLISTESGEQLITPNGDPISVPTSCE